MSVLNISKHEFNKFNINKSVPYPDPERSWFKSTELNIIGTVIRDTFDEDYGFLILQKEEDSVYRPVKVETSLKSQEFAESSILKEMILIESLGEVQETLYDDTHEASIFESPAIVLSIDDELKKYFKKHPEKLYDLEPRKFEELVASIMKDLGFDVQLTQATRDGGRDIIAHVRNQVCSFLTHIECKRYAPDHKVGVGIIREVLGVHQIRDATKSIIVTTSFFTSDAVKEAKMAKNRLDLKDFNDLKDWLSNY